MAELHEIEVTAAGQRADKLIAEALPELSPVCGAEFDPRRACDLR